jgi:putative endonuclease
MWYVYIIECGKTLYVGLTDNIERRFEEHVSGRGGQYTSRNRPERILYTEEFRLKFQGEARERQLKRWSKAKKLSLVNGDLERLSSLSVSRD